MSQNPTLQAQQGLRRADKVFIVLLLGLVGLVTWVGHLSYQKGQQEETSKRHGEAWLKWMNDASEHRHEPGFQPTACAAQKTPSVPTWGECYQSLVSPSGPLGQLHNAFSGAALQRLAKCDPSDRKQAGALIFEKITATPPGSAIASITSPLLDSDEIGGKLQIRISVCSSVSEPVRIGELEF